MLSSVCHTTSWVFQCEKATGICVTRMGHLQLSSAEEYVGAGV